MNQINISENEIIKLNIPVTKLVSIIGYSFTKSEYLELMDRLSKQEFDNPKPITVTINVKPEIKTTISKLWELSEKDGIYYIFTGQKWESAYDYISALPYPNRTMIHTIAEANQMHPTVMINLIRNSNDKAELSDTILQEQNTDNPKKGIIAEINGDLCIYDGQDWEPAAKYIADKFPSTLSLADFEAIAKINNMEPEALVNMLKTHYLKKHYPEEIKDMPIEDLKYIPVEPIQSIGTTSKGYLPTKVQIALIELFEALQLDPDKHPLLFNQIRTTKLTKIHKLVKQMLITTGNIS